MVLPWAGGGSPDAAAVSQHQLLTHTRDLPARMHTDAIFSIRAQRRLLQCEKALANIHACL
jgi:hypothetical protein